MLVGLELHTELSLTGSLCLWFSVILSLGGFGLTLRALEARFGRLSLAEYHGLYEHSPALAVCFLLTGLACVGFPGTLGLHLDRAAGRQRGRGQPLRGRRGRGGGGPQRHRRGSGLPAALHRGASRLDRFARDRDRERFAVLTLSALILGGGFFPQPGVTHATSRGRR